MKHKMSMHGHVSGAAGITVLLLISGVLLSVLSGCEAVFTYSPFSSLQRNPENLSDEQKVEYAEDALNSSDKESVETAYGLVEDLIVDASGEEKIELQQLAADLALKASGISDSMLDVLGEVALADTSADPDALQTALGSAADAIDTEYAAEYLEQIEALPEEEITYDQYFYAAISVVISDTALMTSIEEGTYTYDPASPDPEVTQALAYLENCDEVLPADGSVSSEITAFLDEFRAYIQ